MEIQNAAIVVACVAFLITQAHLWLTARKLLKKSDQSWARVDATINNTLAALKTDLFDNKTAVRLWNWFLTAEIKTDKKVKDEDGNETGVFVTTTPYEQLVSSSATVFLRKARSAKGGIVAGHDYREGSTIGVIPAVDGYAKAHGYSVNLTTGKEEEPSWWFEKRWHS